MKFFCVWLLAYIGFITAGQMGSRAENRVITLICTIACALWTGLMFYTLYRWLIVEWPLPPCSPTPAYPYSDLPATGSL